MISREKAQKRHKNDAIKNRKEPKPNKGMAI